MANGDWAGIGQCDDATAAGMQQNLTINRFIHFMHYTQKLGNQNTIRCTGSYKIQGMASTKTTIRNLAAAVAAAAAAAAAAAGKLGPNTLAHIFAYSPLLEQGWHKVSNREYFHRIGTIESFPAVSCTLT